MAINDAAVQSLVGALGLPLGTSHVLWVDDPSNNYLERRALRRWNVCFTDVRSTPEAVRELEDHPGRHALVISNWGGAPTAKAVGRLRSETRPALIFYVWPDRVNERRDDALKLGALGITGDPFVLSRLSLDALAGRQAVGDGGWSSRLPASLATGLSWLRRQFLACSQTERAVLGLPTSGLSGR